MSDEDTVSVESPPPVGTVTVNDATGDVVVDIGAPSKEVVTLIEESGPLGPEGPQGEVGPPGPTGQGVLVLDADDPVPPGTPDNTVIFRKESG